MVSPCRRTVMIFGCRAWGKPREHLWRIVVFLA